MSQQRFSHAQKYLIVIIVMLRVTNVLFEEPFDEGTRIVTAVKVGVSTA
jgi:hypothetical protein